jgi:hydroxyacylglutathione hydrolase
MLQITPLPAFRDNYIWLLRGGAAGVAVVDPGDPAPVEAALTAGGLGLDALLITHHHRDHTGGIRRLRERYPGARVYGPAAESIPGVTDPVAHGDRVRPWPGGPELRVMDVAGHTAGHIAYHGAGVLFCGDTLFACGCGRLFEGTPAQMTAALERILALPGDTRVYCAHEYTLENIGFAKWVEPDNPALLERERVETARRERGEPTVPFTLDQERATNPFLRFSEPAVIRAAREWAGQPLEGAVEVFAAVRRWKDREYD